MAGSELDPRRPGDGPDAGVPAWLARRLREELADRLEPGADAGELDALLRADPWALLAVPEVRPDQADAFARARLGAAARPDDPRRARAVVSWVLERAARDGSTCLPAGVVGSVLAGLGFPDVPAALDTALEDGSVLAFPTDGPDPADPGPPATAGAAEEDIDPGDADGPTAPEEADVSGLLVLERYAVAEENLAEALLRLAAAVAGSDPDIGPRGSAEGRVELDALLDSGVGILVRPSWPAAATLGAGTEDRGAGGPVLAAAVAELFRLAEGRGLRPTVVTPRTYHEARPDAGLVVLDQAELLDVELAASLAEALPDGTRLVLAGDPAQLPPPGAGAVLRDLVGCGVLPVCEPPVAAAGLLAEVAAAVRGGTLPAVHSPEREVVVVPAAGDGEAAHRTVQLVTDSIPRALGFAPADVQVVVPARNGRCGTTAVNAALKERLNPGPGEFGGFDVGDRVVLTGSGGTGLAPGVTGVVAGKAAGGLVLEVHGRQLEVSRPDRVLAHGWAVPVRLAAGSTWPAVVVGLPGEAAGMLARDLVYTALTRAERHLSVVAAAGAALPAAVAKVPVRPRRTRLAGLLRGSR
jgi:exodeoxyribonuclease V alpha subunit